MLDFYIVITDRLNPNLPSSHFAMENQPKYPIDDQIALYGSYALIGIGLLLSLGSFFRYRSDPVRSILPALSKS